MKGGAAIKAIKKDPTMKAPRQCRSRTENFILASVNHLRYIDSERDNALDKTAPDVAVLRDRANLENLMRKYRCDPIKEGKRRNRQISRTTNKM